MPREIYYTALSSNDVWKETAEFVRQVQLNERPVVKPYLPPPWIQKVPIPNVDSKMKVVVGEIVNPNDFYLVRNESLEEYDKLKKDLANFYQNAPHALTIDPAELYAAKLPQEVESLWGRVVILNSTAARFYQCLFIDLGYSCCLKFSDLHLLNPRFSSIPPRTFKASLIDVSPPDGVWHDKETKFFYEMVKGQVLNAIVKAQVNEVCQVLLDSDFANINEEFQYQINYQS